MQYTDHPSVFMEMVRKPGEDINDQKVKARSKLII